MKASVVILACLPLLSACMAVGPNYRKPELAMPKQWSVATTKTLHTDQWWQLFNDPILNKLIKEAINANLDLKQALVRIKDVRIQRSAVFAAALPSLSAHSNVSRRLNNSSIGGQSNTVSGGFGIGNQITHIFQSGFDAQWELDFFGGVQRTAEALNATLESEIENSRAVLVSLLAEVAKNYIELRGQQKLLAISLDNLAAQQEVEQLTRIRQQSGLSNSLEVTQVQALVANTSATIATYKTQIQQTTHALSVLLGHDPAYLLSPLLVDFTNFNDIDTTSIQIAIPQVNTEVLLDLPSELLKRRPDIRHAERLMAVAVANIGIATAELYPKINLSAFLGLQNSNITNLTPVGKSWSTAASLSMPIFNWGKLQADIKSKRAQSEQAFLTYQATILNAFKEVENALVAFHQEQQRSESLAQAVAANQLAVQLANERYQKGLTAFIDVLNSQQALLQSQSELTRSEWAISTHLIALYKALGGGWQTEAKVNEPPQATKKNLAEHIYNVTKKQ